VTLLRRMKRIVLAALFLPVEAVYGHRG